MQINGEPAPAMENVPDENTAKTADASFIDSLVSQKSKI